MAFFTSAKTISIKTVGVKATPPVHFNFSTPSTISQGGSSFHGSGTIEFHSGGHSESGSIGYNGAHGGFDVSVTHGCTNGSGCVTGGSMGGHINF